MHTSWGSNPICFLNISCLHLIFDPDDVSPWKTNIFRLGIMCHHEKCRGFVYSLMIFSSIGILISLVSFQSGTFNHVLIWVFDIIWAICFLVTLVCALLVYLVVSKLYLVWFLKVMCLHIYYMYILWHAYFR